MAIDKLLTKERGNFIEKCRLASGLSMVETSKKLSAVRPHAKKTRSAWNNWETGYCNLDFDGAPEIAEILNTTPWKLLWSHERPDWFDPFEDIFQHNLKLEQLLSITMSDESLSPEIKSGDKLLIKKGSVNITQQTLIMIKGKSSGHWIRYIKPEINGGYKIYCHDKINYPDQEIESLDDINIIGVVKSITHWL